MTQTMNAEDKAKYLEKDEVISYILFLVAFTVD